MQQPKMRNWICFLGLILILFISIASSSDKKVVCYYGSWSTYRPGNGKFEVENFNPNLCTHAIYTFVGLTLDGGVRILDSWNEIDREGFKRFNAMRSTNPNLKTIVAIGGWNEGSTSYSTVMNNDALRSAFVQNVVKFVQQYGFDGFDLDWEYPCQRGGASSDKDACVNYWLSEGAPPEKIILGMGLYGRSFTMAGSQCALGVARTGAGTAGPYTREAGMLGFNEICENNWTEKWDDQQQVPYACKGNQLVGYDSIKSIKIKSQYVLDKGLGGAMVWSVETDDFTGKCYGYKYPLLRAINCVLNDLCDLERYQNSTVCCEKIGCYSTKEPWVTSSRQLPDPQCPPNITIQFVLYTRENNSTTIHNITSWPEFEIDASIFDNKTTMVFIPDVGYSYEDELSQELKDAFMERAKNNSTTIHNITSWPEYEIDASIFDNKTTMVFIPDVGYSYENELSQELKDAFMERASMHVDSNVILIDWSHNGTYAQAVSNGRVIAGKISRFGHVDFFFNGGLTQSGCPIIQYGDKVNEMVNGDYTTFYDNPDTDNFRCSHNRVLQYFTTALSNVNCTYWGLTRTVFRFILDVFSSGFFAPFVTRLKKCTLQTCTAVGLNTIKYIARGSFDVATKDYYPYCIKKSSVDKNMEKSLRQYELDTGNDWDNQDFSTTPADIFFMNATES
ncbi:hypothetical protein C0J52_14524 [Blattella germanica]|nr:hypothetical protein C0J52_14524 [Blattella germanica]